MNRGNKIFYSAFAAYLIAFLLTFGYSFNRDYDKEAVSGINTIRAFLCAVGWPAYLSKIAFEGVRRAS